MNWIGRLLWNAVLERELVYVPDTIKVARAVPASVPAPPRPIRTWLQDNGWVGKHLVSNIRQYRGSYRAFGRSWNGIMLESGGGKSVNLQFFIENPPHVVLAGSAWAPCFMNSAPQLGPKWRRVGFKGNEMPETASSGIITINGVLDECYRRYRARAV